MIRPFAPVAQLDRVPDYESGGRTFESYRARHIQKMPHLLDGAFLYPVALVDIRGAARLTEAIQLKFNSDRTAGHDSFYQETSHPYLSTVFGSNPLSLKHR